MDAYEEKLREERRKKAEEEAADAEGAEGLLE